MEGILRSPLLQSLGVPHAFTTRAGGVSRGIFASLNFGNPMDLPDNARDPAENITENFRRVLHAIGTPGREVTQVYQIHSDRVHIFRAGGPSRNALPDGEIDFKADALVTDDPSRTVAVRVADCTPVLLSSKDGRVVSAVHAGWRGVVADIVSHAVRAMRSLGAEELVGAIGPCIGADHFEVGPEVIAEFHRAFGDGMPVRMRPDGRGHPDLKAALHCQLVRAGLLEIDVLPGCSVSEPDRFFSHRRDRGATGRMAALIGPAD